MLTHSELDPLITFGSGEVLVLTLPVSVRLMGRMAKDLTIPGEIAVTAVTRQGSAFLATGGTAFRSGDLIHLTLAAGAVDRLKTLVDLE